MSELKDKTVKGVAWSAVDKFSSLGITFVFGVLIARILLPEDYGVVAMLGIFMAIANVFIDSGFAGALIQKKDRTDDDYNTVFYFNIAISVFFCVLFWVTAPLIASFYKIPLLTKVTRAVSVTLVINSLRAVQETQLSVVLDFRSRAFVTIFCTLAVGIVGLIMAKNGYGVWALVAQSIVGCSLRTVSICCIVRWKPKLVFSKKSFKELFGFGSKMLGSSLLDTVYNNIYSLVIGKIYSPASLGVYNRAEQLASFPSSSMTGMLQTVTYPALSSIQDDQERLRGAYKRLLNVSAFVVFPAMVGLAAVADPFIRILLTDKWAGAIIFLQIICFDMMWYPIHAINLNILLVKGRSDYFLKLEIIKKIIGTVVLCATIPFGLVAMCLGRIASSLVNLVVNTYYNEELIGYGYIKQMKNLLPLLIHSLIMGAIVFIVVNLLHGMWLQLIVGVSVGIVYYIAGAYVFKFPELQELINILKRK